MNHFFFVYLLIVFEALEKPFVVKKKHCEFKVSKSGYELITLSDNIACAKNPKFCLHTWPDRRKCDSSKKPNIMQSVSVIVGSVNCTATKLSL